MAKPRNTEPSYYEQLAAMRIDIPVPVQDQLAGLVQAAYSSPNLGPNLPTAPGRTYSNPVFNQIGAQPIDLGPLQSYLPGVNTIRGVEQALANSTMTKLMTMTDKVDRSGGHFDDVFSNMYAGVMQASRNYDPTKGHFETYALKQAYGVGVKELRAEQRQGLSLEGVEDAAGEDGLAAGATGITGNAQQIVGGPSSTRWYNGLLKTENNVPTPFYAPTGQGLLVGNEFNPNLTTRPGSGLSQVVATPADLQQYAAAQAQREIYERNARLVPELAEVSNRGLASVGFQTPNKPVESFLRDLSGGLRGGGGVTPEQDMSDDRGWAPPGFGSEIELDNSAIYQGGYLQDFNKARSEVFKQMTGKQAVLGPRGVYLQKRRIEKGAWQSTFQSGFRKTEAFQGLVSRIGELAGTDPASAAAMYLKSEGDYGLMPSDIAGMRTKDMAFSEYVSANRESVRDVLETQSGSYVPNASEENLEATIAGLKESDFDAATAGQVWGATGNAPRNKYTAAQRKQFGRAKYAAEAFQARQKRSAARTPVTDNAPSIPEPEAPPEFGAYSRASVSEAEVSDVRNSDPLDAPASAETSERVAAEVSDTRNPAPVSKAAEIAQRAVAGRSVLEGNRDYVDNWMGKGAKSAPGFEKWLGEQSSEFQQARADVLAEHQAVKNAPQTSGTKNMSQYSQMLNTNGGWKGDGPASSSSAATPPVADAPLSPSNGSGGGSKPPTTPAPVAAPEPRKPNAAAVERNAVKAAASEDAIPEYNDFGVQDGDDLGSIFDAPGLGTGVQSDDEGAWEALKNNQAKGDREFLKRKAEAVGQPAPSPTVGDTSRLSQPDLEREETTGWNAERRADLKTTDIDRARARAGRSPMSAERANQMAGEARKLGALSYTTTYNAGNVHGNYGIYEPNNPNKPAEGGSWMSTQDGKTTITTSTAEKADEVFRNALGQALDAGNFSGSNKREFAATLHKRVQEGISRLVNDTVKEMEETTGSKSQAEGYGRQIKTVADGIASDAMQRFRADEGLPSKNDLNYSSIKARGKGIHQYYNDPRNPEFKEAIDNIGGPQAAMSGPARIVEAGNQTYEVGRDVEYGGGSKGSKWGNAFKSLYSTSMGHLMMAQFMGQMAWKSTGGSVLDSANTWATQQQQYAAMAAFGGGELGSAEMSAARQEMAGNQQGSLAYEQYGAIKEMGYVVGNLPGGDNILRGVNDAKMAAGAGAVAGIGTWAAGTALGGLGATALGTAVVGAAAPVGAAVAAAVALPSLAMTGANAALGYDSYEGYGWKNVLTGGVMSLASLGADRSEITGKKDLVSRFFGQFLAGATGAQQENFAQKAFGMSTSEFIKSTWVGDLIGSENADWLGEGRSEKAQAARELVGEIQGSTGLKEDTVLKGVAAATLAFGGLDTDAQKQSAKSIMGRAADLGVDVSAILSDVGNLASQRGIYTGTQEFETLAVDFANMSQVEQQREMKKSARASQQYSMWAPYLEGGMGEAYELYNKSGVTTQMQAQAVQSTFLQSQMAGETLTPGIAAELAQLSMSMTPGQATSVAQMSTSMMQTGAGSFTGNFSQLSGMVSSGAFGISRPDGGTYSQATMALSGENVQGNAAQSLNFLQGVTQGNQYALSDYGRMAGIGVLQSVDPNGLQTGLKDMTGFLQYAQQDILRTPGLSGAQTLAGLGMSFSNTSESAMLAGTWAYQKSYTDQVNAFQSQALDQQGIQLASQRQSTYQSWGIETQMNNEQWASQLRNFEFSGTMMDTQRQHRLEDADAVRQERGLSNENRRWTQGFDYETSLIKRDWAREDYQYNGQMRSLQQGWSSEDMNEQIRRASGYDRAMLIKQRDRMNTSNNLENGQFEKQGERQEEMWAREDERYAKSLSFNEQMIALDEDRFERNQRQAEEIYQLQKGHLSDEIQSATELHELRLEMEALQRRRQEEQMQYAETSLNLQREQMSLQVEYANNMRILSNTQTEMEASLRKITQYSPAFSRMLQDFLSFMQQASNVRVPTTGSGVTYQ